MALQTDDKINQALTIAKFVNNDLASNQSSPYLPYNRQTHGDGYRKPGEGQQREYEMEEDGQFKLPIDLAHDAPGQNLVEQWGATILPDGKTWMMPTKEGTLRYATPEESQLLDENMKMRDSATGPWWSDHTHEKSEVNYGQKTPLDRYWEKEGYPNKETDSDVDRIRKIRGSLPYKTV
tara:strand:+ start:2169 stop:2705 length:537 start_codon:yes stop_codon:yes gene_type:complete